MGAIRTSGSIGEERRESRSLLLRRPHSVAMVSRSWMPLLAIPIDPVGTDCYPRLRRQSCGSQTSFKIVLDLFKSRLILFAWASLASISASNISLSRKP
jgi:hypothetical protein